MRNSVLGVLSICLLLSLASCASSLPSPLVCPPASLTLPCEVPRFAGRTNGDMLDWIELDVGQTLRNCNADKAALRSGCALSPR